MTDGLNRARVWLRSHRLDIEPTPLVVQRLRARRNAALAEAATLLAGTAGLVGWVAIDSADGSKTNILVLQIGPIVIMVLGAIVGMGWQRWFERTLLLAYAVAGAVGWYFAERSVRCARPREPVAL